ncbi:uncharacterized protein Dana_GF16548 [Drosophila ananassae]|uniref:Serine protease K12H4.7 n=1 Tax=Drosophila ananassae TaxID=7217 RepID=B3M261_DROAN|nr:thymus-specific serine protease [Drosophila ananassae]EDV43385.2 uncharacterized protein Dana_GF16548 [Drosophila ananassae]
MKCFFEALAILAVLSAPTVGASFKEPMPKVNRLPKEPMITRATVHERWINQKLDNFDEDNNATWSNRIFINEQDFVDGSPIFIYLGGESEQLPSRISSGLWVDIAKQHNGTIVATEHRFYGKSTPITPYSTENLEKYQSINQALADVINVIQTLKEEDKYKDSKVVIHGCSYSATMAAWIRKLYPDIIVGSWASSAPLVAKVEFKEYFKVIGESFRILGGQYCYDLIDNATNYYENLFANGKGDQAKKELNLCDDFDPKNEWDRWHVFINTAMIFADIAQYQKPANKDIHRTCMEMRSFSDDDSVALSKFVNWKTNNHTGVCINVTFANLTEMYEKGKENYEDSALPWLFQSCREFGWFQTSGSSQQPFGTSFPLRFSEDLCEEIFGSSYNPAGIRSNVMATNAEFGGLDIDYTNVYFVYGELDGWTRVGAEVSQGATIIPQASHCPDTDSIAVNDSPELLVSKKKVIALVDQWLEEAQSAHF